MPPSPDPVWVHVATTHPVVELGLRTMLEGLDTPFPVVTSGPDGAEPDVVLFDVVLLEAGDATSLEHWMAQTATTVIAVDRTLRPDLGAQARTHGIEWGITLAITAPELAQVVQEAVAGQLEDSAIAQEWDTADYLGQEAGLTPREAGVLALVVQGRSNVELAEELFLSINSVKSYIRSAYRKLGVTSRAQAVAWGVQHGFPVEPVVEPGDQTAAEPV